MYTECPSVTLLTEITYFAVLFADDMEGDSIRGCLDGGAGAGVDDPLFTHYNTHSLNLLMRSIHASNSNRKQLKLPPDNKTNTYCK